MRLNRLDLTRYGKFTDERIDFGDSRSGVPDLHVVYGPNEAGKSTALAAYLDLLFGIDLRSPYNFVHPYSTMRVGAAIETASGLREIVRVKTRKDSLLDGQERPIGDGALIADLGGLERASYNTMFSLDDKSFEAGGESILASQAISASSCSRPAPVSPTSAAASPPCAKRRIASTRRAPRSGALIELKVQLGALKQKRDEIDTRASAHAQLVEERDRAGRDYETGNALLGRLEARKEDLRRRLAALPRLAELREIRTA